MKNKKVLILGGAGFIGFGIIKHLFKEKKYDITVADIFKDGQDDNEFKKLTKNENFKVIKGDFTKKSSFDKLSDNYDYFYMLASVVGVNKCIEDPHDVIRTNSLLIMNSLEWIITKNIGKVLFSSSSECYASTTDNFLYDIPTNEKVPLSISDISHPRNTYAVTKMFGESAFLTFGKKYNFPITIVRYQNIYGPRMGFKHVIPHLVERFIKIKENPFKIYGHDQTRAFCYLDDAAKGTVMAMENKNTNQEIFHIGSENEISIENLVKTVGDLLDYRGDYSLAETYPGSVSRRCPDIKKSMEYFNFSPNVSLLDGLKKTIDWYKIFFDNNFKIISGGFKAPDELDFKSRYDESL